MHLAIAENRREVCALYPVEARLYALRELTRRAGVSREMFRNWRIEPDDGAFLTVYVKRGSNRRIRFPLARESFWQNVQAGRFRTATAHWMASTPASFELVPDFRVPFASLDSGDVGPLFRARGEDCVECAVDLPASILLTLSRFEETLPQPCDAHARFSAYSSLAWRDDFLHRPAVDEYGLAFAEALAFLLPGWQPARPHLKVKLGHDVDQIGTPFVLRTTAAHTLRRGSPSATLRDLLALSSFGEPAYQHLLRRLVNLARERALDTAVYWKASAPGRHDTGYDPRSPKICKAIDFFRQQGVEMGIHLSYAAADSAQCFEQEVTKVRELLGEERLGGRQDFLRWSPQTWVRWDAAGLAYDASVGFADHVGFRAGTAHPYFPWLLSLSRQANLMEIPLLAMDSTLKGYMKLSPESALHTLRGLITRCRLTGGVFTLAWHNTTLMDSGYARVYKMLLDDLAGSEPFDWTATNHATL